MPYHIIFADETEAHLRCLSVRDRRAVFDAIAEQLLHQPTLATRNRQPLRPSSIAAWKLRVGNLRVYYDVEEMPVQLVRILAIAVKERNRVRIGDRYFELWNTSI